jgi:hypothetical protein
MLLGLRTAIYPVGDLEAAMPAILQAQPELANVRAINGFCDEPQDHARFAAAQFDAIVSRQVVNGLFDPLLAFRHWHRSRWLRHPACSKRAASASRSWGARTVRFLSHERFCGTVTRAARDPRRAPACVAGALHVAENSF